MPRPSDTTIDSIIDATFPPAEKMWRLCHYLKHNKDDTRPYEKILELAKEINPEDCLGYKGHRSAADLIEQHLQLVLKDQANNDFFLKILPISTLLKYRYHFINLPLSTLAGSVVSGFGVSVGLSLGLPFILKLTAIVSSFLGPIGLLVGLPLGYELARENIKDHYKKALEKEKQRAIGNLELKPSQRSHLYSVENLFSPLVKIAELFSFETNPAYSGFYKSLRYFSLGEKHIVQGLYNTAKGVINIFQGKFAVGGAQLIKGPLTTIYGVIGVVATPYFALRSLSMDIADLYEESSLGKYIKNKIRQHQCNALIDKINATIVNDTSDTSTVLITQTLEADLKTLRFYDKEKSKSEGKPKTDDAYEAINHIFPPCNPHEVRVSLSKETLNKFVDGVKTRICGAR